MSQSDIKLKNKVIRKKVEEFFDVRDNFYKILKKFEDKNGYIPKKYFEDKAIMNAYNEYKLTGGWRNNPYVIKRMKKIIKKFRKNIDKQYKGVKDAKFTNYSY